MNSEQAKTRRNDIYKIVKPNAERIINSGESAKTEAKAKETYNSAIRSSNRVTGSNKAANRKGKERGW